MTSRKALVNVLTASGVADDDAIQLAAITPAMGASWTNEVLNTGRVDELKFAAELARLFREPCEHCEPSKIDRAALQLLPSRFVFKHHMLPLGQKGENIIRLATFDVINSISRKLAGQALPGKKI